MKNIHISPVDSFFVNGSYPIELLYYYQNRISGNAIRKALKLCSQSFWPVFGRYENGRIYSEKFVEAEFFNETDSDKNFDPNAESPEIWENYKGVNPDPLQKLFFINVLQFKNGTVIIPKMNHLAGDGYSYFYFLGVLAALTQRSFIPFRGLVVRTLSAPHHNRTVLNNFLFQTKEIEEPVIHRDCSIHFLKIPKKDIREQIKQIGKEKKESVSTNDILSAMVVKNTVERQHDKFNKVIKLTIPIDVRRQVGEYGTKFFGNGLYFHHLDIELDEPNMPPVENIAIAFRDSMPHLDRNFYMAFLENLEKTITEAKIHSLKPYDPETGCLVTNLSRIPADRLNFGAGNPDFIFPLTIAKNSATVLADAENFILRLVY